MTEYQSRPEGAVELSEEDKVRMARLYEEVSGRVTEMALIVGRTLGRDTEDAIEIAFARTLKERNGGTTPAPPDPSGRMIHFSNCEWGCYDYVTGECYPC